MGSPLEQRGRPKGPLRLLLRTPIALYRMRLGFLFGRRFLLLEHVGRSSGRPRYAVVEVVDYDSSTGRYWVCSGWGRHADWYRNIVKTPSVHLTVGAHRVQAVARELPEGEAAAPLARYAAAHPRALRKLAELMLSEAPPGLDETVRQLARTVPVIELSAHS